MDPASPRSVPISDFAPVGYTTLSREGALLEINRPGAALWGRDPETLLGKSLADLVEADYRPSVLNFIQSLFQTGLKQTCEVRLVHDGPLPRFVQIIGIAGDEEGREGRKCFAAFIDITERKRVEDALQLSQFSINHAVDPVFWIEPVGRLSFVNDATCGRLGFSREEMLGLSLRDLEPDLTPDQWILRCGRIRGQGTVAARTRLRAKTGEIFPAEINFSSLKFNEGEFIVAFVRDLSEQSRVEGALRVSEARYRQLFESISDYVYTVRVESGRAVATSHGPGCVQVTGYTPQDYRDDPNLWYRMIHEDDRNRVLAQAQAAITGLPTPPVEHRILHKDGTVRWIRNTAVVRKDDGGHVALYEGVIVDITARKQAEQDLLAANANLERLHRDRDEFLVMISHDLRTPLVTGLGYIDMIVGGQLGDLPPEALAGLKVALKNLRRLQQLIDDVLNYQTMSIQSESGRLSMEPLDLARLLRECGSDFLVRTGRPSHTLTLEIPDGLPAAHGNLDMIRRALANLLNNAHKHAGASTRVYLGAARAGADRIRCYVRDEGPGIPPELRETIFDPFVKSGKSREGSGLGLAIVRYIARAHGGAPELRTETGRGAEIAFHLPVSAGLPAAAPVTPLEDTYAVRHPHARILVVDDDADTLDFVRLMLQKHGYDVTTVPSGEEGRDILRRESFDIALIDMTLTGMDGVELCRIIKSEPATAQLPVYMFSALADEGSLERARQVGCDGYITKPIAMAEFLKTLENALS